MAGKGNRSGFVGMFQLPVTAALTHDHPAIPLQLTKQISNLHAISSG
jgi:hypothetical protein